MKLALPLFFLLLGSAWSAPAFVQANVCGGGSPYACAYAGSVTAGNVLTASCIESADTAMTVTDTQGNVYTLALHDPGRGNRLYTAIASASGSVTVTVTRSGVVNAVVIGEYSGVNPGAGLDGNISGSGSSVAGQQRVATDSPFSLTTTLASDIIICSVRDYDAVSVTPSSGQWSNADALTFRAGFHELSALFDTLPGHIMPGVTGYYTGAGSTSAALCGAFKASSASSTAITRRFVGMGK